MSSQAGLFHPHTCSLPFAPPTPPAPLQLHLSAMASRSRRRKARQSNRHSTRRACHLAAHISRQLEIFRMPAAQPRRADSGLQLIIETASNGVQLIQTMKADILCLA